MTVKPNILTQGQSESAMCDINQETKKVGTLSEISLTTKVTYQLITHLSQPIQANYFRFKMKTDTLMVSAICPIMERKNLISKGELPTSPTT